jgi:hypothetical protein
MLASERNALINEIEQAVFARDDEKTQGTKAAVP